MRFDDYGKFEVLSLNDPKVIVLPDGRYRMYVATMIRTGPEENDIKWAITSATTSATIDVMIHSSERPAGFRLEQNYPNPFNLQTRIDYNLPEKSRVMLTIHDIMGRDVLTLVDELQEPGIKTVSWTGVRKDGCGISAGLYFCKIQVGNFKKMRKLLLLK
ncbi:MAG: T9SS type A sorting domain-containing protein [Candidatus Neomarinimicrobiota bacterium]|nr:T9SS type A sorting domain-containing protein [Candidatus Neomarinimicrobiota bacterium]